MYDLPEPCGCTLKKRAELRDEHMKRSGELSKLASRLCKAGAITDDEAALLYQQSEEAWDDAIHIASPSDPLRSLCGSLGRNLVDLPERPDGMSGCWGCLVRADAEADQRELATA